MQLNFTPSTPIRNASLHSLLLHLWAVAVITSFFMLSIHGQETSAEPLPYDLSSLLRDMKDDDTPNNATHAYHKILDSKNELTKKQKQTVVNQLEQTIRNGDEQQAVLSAGVLHRWKGRTHHLTYTRQLVPKMCRLLITETDKTLTSECQNIISELLKLRDYEGKTISFSRKEVNKLLDRTTWTGSRTTKKKLSLLFGRLLKLNLTSKTTIHWIRENLKDDEIRSNANRALSILRRMDRNRLVALLKKLLHANDRQTRQLAAYIFVDQPQFDPETAGEKIIDVLVDGLRDDDINHLIRNASQFSEKLVDIGPPAHDQLKQALRSDDRQQAQLAAWVLTQSPKFTPTDSYINELVKGLRGALHGHSGEQFSNRNWTYDALVELGKRAHPYLLRALKSNNRQQRLYAARALLRTGHRSDLDRIVSILVRQFKEDDIRANGRRTEWFIEALKGKRIYQSTIQPRLRQLLQNGTPQQCAAAIHLLDSSELPEQPPKHTIKLIKTYLKSDNQQDEWIRSATLYCGRSLGSALEQLIQNAMKNLFRKLHDQTEHVQQLSDRLNLPYLFRARQEYLRYYIFLSFLQSHQDEFAAEFDVNLAQKKERLMGELSSGMPFNPVAKQNKTKLTDREEQTIRRNIRRLKSPSYQKRKTAMERLLQKGLDILPILHEYYPNKNPEMHNRLQNILFELAGADDLEQIRTLYQQAK